MNLILKKKFYIIPILLLFTNFLNGQILKNVNLDLNLGGAIYDVAYDDYLKAYIVVGDFTTVNGQPRKNLAVINASDMTLSSKILITNIDGPIRTVEVHKKESIIFFPPYPPYSPYFLPGLYSVFIGGDFNTINGSQRIKVARLSFSFSAVPDGNEIYSLSTWNAEIENEDPNNHPNYGEVNDISINGDTMVVVGDFYIDNPTYEPLLGMRSSV